MTILAILFTDLLVGISIGIATGIFFVLKTNLHQSITVIKEGSETYIFNLEKDVSFLNKAYLRKRLKNIPSGSKVIIDESDSIWIDQDVLETIEDFKSMAENENITVEIRKPKKSKNPKFIDAS